MRTFRLWDIIVVGSVVLVACAPVPASTAEVMMQETPMSDAMMEPATPTAAAMMDNQPAPAASAVMDAEAAMPPAADWMGMAMSDVVTGQQFRLSDFHNKVVLIEPMAVWCTKCRALQQEIRRVHEQLGGQAAELVTISIDVDPNEDQAYLKAYVDQAGHDWAFAIAPAELSRALAAAYGDQVLNPPSTPLLIIDRNGTAQLLPFGPKTAADLLNALQPLLDAGM